MTEWIDRTCVLLAKDADVDGQRKNALLTAPSNARRGVARQGKSVYATIHASRDEVWDICAEAAS